MWPKIRAIPGLRLVHRWVQGHICAKTDTGYFKIIVGLLKDDFDAWEKAGFEPEHEYMTHMSKSALIDMVRCGVPFRLLCVVDRRSSQLDVQTYTYHQLSDCEHAYEGKFSTARARVDGSPRARPPLRSFGLWRCCRPSSTASATACRTSRGRSGSTRSSASTGSSGTGP